MKTVLKYLALAGLAAVSFGCRHAEPEIVGNDGPQENPSVEMKTFRFTASLENDGTRTTLNNEDHTVSWAVEDEVKFIYEVDGRPGENKAVLGEDDIDEGGKASFTVELPAVFGEVSPEVRSRHLYAVSPAATAHDYSTASSLFITIPTEQDGSFANASIALAKWDDKNPGAALNFQNLCGLLQFTIADEKVAKVVLTARETLAGKMDVGFSTGYPEVKKKVEEDCSEITVNVSGEGTYYIAVAPGTLEGFYLAFYDKEGHFLGDKSTEKTLVVTRNKITALGTLAPGTAGDANTFFVKPDGSGTGTSWDDAASYADLCAKLAGNGIGEIHMAAGVYNVTETTEIPAAKTSGNYKIYGGYPENAIGRSLYGRTPGTTVLDGTDYNGRAFDLSAGAYLFDGLTWQNFKSTGAVIVRGKAQMACNHCVFQGNKSSSNGSAVYFYAAECVSSFEDCLFSSNEALTQTTNNGLGAAVGSAGTYFADAAVTFDKCLFTGNHSYNGGAIWTRCMSFRVRDCAFVDNYADGGNGGGAIFVDNANALSIYLDRVYFGYTDGTKVGKLATVRVSNAKASLGLNNCTFAGSWGGSGIMQVSAYGNTVVSNSTLLGRIGTGGTPTLYGSVHNQGTMLVVNCIIPNAASNGAGRSLTTYGTSLSLYNTLYSVLSGTANTYTENNCLSGIKVFETQKDTNFPVYGGTEWYAGGSYTAQDKTKTQEVDDCRAVVHYYEWDGSIPKEISGAETYVNISLTELEALVNEADANYKTWLGNGLSVDIRGEQRAPEALWPGSYQGN